MYRRRKAGSFNRGVMLGVMATAVVVLAVSVCFWLWCFPEGTKVDGAARADYRVLLTEGFAGDSIVMAVNDSVVANEVITGDSVVVRFALPAGQGGVLMLSLPSSGNTYAFDLPSGGGKLTLRSENGRVSEEKE